MGFSGAALVRLKGVTGDGPECQNGTVWGSVCVLESCLVWQPGSEGILPILVRPHMTGKCPCGNTVCDGAVPMWV